MADGIVGKISVGDGATFTPHVDADGILTFTNNKNLPNPDPFDIPAHVIESGAMAPGSADGTISFGGNDVAVTGWGKKADLASPAFTGTPTAPTQAVDNNSTRLATTEFVHNNLKNGLALGVNDLTFLNNENDLNNITTEGTYRWYNSSVPANAVEQSVGSAKMFVYHTATDTYTIQIILSAAGDWYKRHSTNNGSTWSDWKHFAMEEDVLPLTGGTLTGNILRSMNFTATTVDPNTTPYAIKCNNIEKGVATGSTRTGGICAAFDKDGKFLTGIYHRIYDSGTTELRFSSNASADYSSQVWLVSSLSGSRVLQPYPDNAINLGLSNYRWKQLFAGTTTISTSDERLKDNIVAIPDEVLDAWGEVGWYQYQFKDSIEEKGETKARIHTGAIAQRIESIFSSHGLDANKYGLLCYDEWKSEPAERDEDGNIVQEARPAGNRYSLRYEEALCMEAAYQRRRADRLEERIARLEALIEAQNE